MDDAKAGAAIAVQRFGLRLGERADDMGKGTTALSSSYWMIRMLSERINDRAFLWLILYVLFSANRMRSFFISNLTNISKETQGLNRRIYRMDKKES